MIAFDETLDSEIPDRYETILRGDPKLSAFLGADGVEVRDVEDELLPLRAPFLALTPIAMDEMGGMSGLVDVKPRILVTAYLPRQSSPKRAIAVPSKPVPVLAGSGALTGSVRYAVTNVTAAGEGYASDLSNAVTCAGSSVSIPVPVGPDGTVGRRVWRAIDGTCALFMLAVRGNAAATITDSGYAVGDELFPERRLVQKFWGRIKSVTRQNSTLLLSTTRLTDDLVRFVDKSDGISPSRNLRVKQMEVQFSAEMDERTRRSTANS